MLDMYSILKTEYMNTKKFKVGDIVENSYGQWEYIKDHDLFPNGLGIFKPLGNFYTPYAHYSDGTYPLDKKYFKLVRSKHAKNYLPDWL